MSKITIVLMRHGETVFNLEDKTQGWCDSFLTKSGKQMTRNRIEELKAHGYSQFDAIYSSDSARAIQTGRIVACEYNMDPDIVKLHSGMREYNYGSFEGGSNKKMYKLIARKAFFDSRYRPLLKTNDISYIFDIIAEINSTKNQAYISETANDFLNRVTLSVKEIAVDAYEKGYTNVLVATHGHALLTIFAALAKEEYDRTFPHLPEVANCATLVLEYDTTYETYTFKEFFNTPCSDEVKQLKMHIVLICIFFILLVFPHLRKLLSLPLYTKSYNQPQSVSVPLQH